MSSQRSVRLFRNGRNQAVRIPRDLELPGTDLAAATNLALPMGPTYDEAVARAVVSALADG